MPRLELLFNSRLLFGAKHEVQQLVAVLADNRLLVSALDVMPLDPVIVKVVQNADARLVITSLTLLPVVRLAFLEATSIRPETVFTRIRARNAATC